MLARVSSSGIGLLQYFGVAAAFDPWVNQSLFGETFANLRQRNQFVSLTNTVTPPTRRAQQVELLNQKRPFEDGVAGLDCKESEANGS